MGSMDALFAANPSEASTAGQWFGKAVSSMYMDPRDVCSANDSRCISFVQSQQNQARAVYTSGVALAGANDFMSGGARVRSSLLEAPQAVSKTLGARSTTNLGASNFVDTTFQTQHYAPRLIDSGVSVIKAESIISSQIASSGEKLIPGCSFGARILVDGVQVEYRAFVLSNAKVNVGTIFSVK